MYKLASAVVLPRQLYPQWVEKDLKDAIVSKIFSTYYEVYLTLTVEPSGETVYVDLSELKAEYASYNNTLGVLLQVIGDRALTHLPGLPSKKLAYVKHVDGHQFGYKIQLCDRTVAYSSNIPRELRRDLLVTRPRRDTQTSMLHTHCLVSVAGFFHMTDTDGEQAFVVDGGNTVQRANCNHFGITSFYDAGPLTKISLKAKHIGTDGENRTLKDRVVITLDHVVESQAFFLILGGYLVIPQEGIFYQTGEKTFEVDLKALMYPERYFESRYALDLSSLGFTETAINDTAVLSEELWSDAVIQKYFTLSQSFFVLVDSPKLSFRKIFLREFTEPNVFTSYQEPTFPLFLGYGRTAEYVRRREEQSWIVTVANGYQRNYLFPEVIPQELSTIHDQMAFNHPFTGGKPYLLEIAATVE